MSRSATAPRRFIAPEVVQSSTMDCGPAALKCLLDGHGIPVSYGRLREACQTDVDGTSIDTLEDVAVQLGLRAEQVVVPADHLLLPEAALLPALVVTQLANGVTHFVVAWRRHGAFLQIMDPGTGRRWTPLDRFLDELYVHEMSVSAHQWIEWAQGEEFRCALRRRINDLGVRPADTDRLILKFGAGGTWQPSAALDAATRLVASLVASRGLARGRQAAALVERLAERAGEPDEPYMTPQSCWTVRPAASVEGSGRNLILRGAVLVTVKGRRDRVDRLRASHDLPPALAVALDSGTPRPVHHLLSLLADDGLTAPLSIAGALLAAAGGVAVEAILLRGLLSIDTTLNLAGQRWTAVMALLVLLAVLTLLDCSIASGLLGLGRRLEMRLRVAFLRKLPRLGDRYLRSRLHSDMVERSHSLQRIRQLPELGAQMLRTLFQLLLTACGIVWLDPASLPLVVVAVTMAVSIPLVAQPLLQERDLRVRSHAGALSRFYLDALLGLVAIRAHGAETAMRREHESLLVEWGRAGLYLQRAAITAEGVELLAGSMCSVVLLLAYWTRVGELGGMLLFAYWVIGLPALGSELASIARQYPAERSTILRLTEPLGAPDEHAAAAVAATRENAGSARAHENSRQRTSGVAICLEGVTVHAAGRAILDDVSLSVAPGSHVAIVGTSGAGKSSLVGLLLGWHAPAAGCVRVDGQLLDAPRLDVLRHETAWVDPEVRLWNRPLMDNLRYGVNGGPATSPDVVIRESELRPVLDRLPDGLQTVLGEGGALVSGGEGQRVRFGRALSRPDVRLVILDEPFRGLDRDQRRTLLSRSRQAWGRATLFCVTHDVGETLDFDRVLVVERGRIVEDSVPAVLAAASASRYRQLLDAEREMRNGLWTTANGWRRLRVEDGRIVETEI